MDLQLTDRVGIVTGASRGIGRAIAGTLAAEGMRLSLVARTGPQLEDLAASLPTACLVQALDLRQADAPAAVVAATVAHFGRLDLLVNNAGATPRGDFLALADADWQDGFALKFFGAMRCCRAAWPHLVKCKGAIINIAGVGGRTGDASFTVGGSVNSALLYLTKALADRGVKDGVRVNAINPGLIVTDRLEKRLQRIASEQGMEVSAAAQRMQQEMGIARFGEPAEVARAVAFLASSQAGYCQGVILDVDGGRTRTL
jgi:3-oxoacyl-[acyl-carrier protein] reductase